jgi:hypothetical protein
MIEGRDFPGRMFEEPEKRFGFFASRWREAEDEQAAELAAVNALREEFRDAGMPLLEGEAAPTLHLAEIEQMQAFPEKYPETGATWFVMGEPTNPPPPYAPPPAPPRSP